MTENTFSRRAFLRLGFDAACMGMALSFATPVWAATAKTHKPATAIPTDAASDIPPRKPRAPRLLMLDPGHGGHDPGAIGPSGAQEKDITLDIARRMADSLSGKTNITVKLTRDEDVFLPLEERVRRAQAAHADMFVSIHADSAPNSAARGLSVYTLSTKASDDFSKILADKENKADLLGGLDLPPADKEVTAILLDLTARRTRNTAQHARAGFVDKVGRKWRLLESPMRSANFVVLRAPDVPSMLVETGFLSNPSDEKLLCQPQQRDKIAHLMAGNLSEILDSALFG